MRNAIIFLDSGDTLVDESTEVRIKGDVVDHAEFFPGIKEVLFQLKNAGFRVALVAGGLCMMIPGTVSDLIGFALLAGVVLWQKASAKKTAAA